MLPLRKDETQLTKVKKKCFVEEQAKNAPFTQLRRVDISTFGGEAHDENR